MYYPYFVKQDKAEKAKKKIGSTYVNIFQQFKILFLDIIR